MADDFHKPTRFPADRFELIVGGEDPAQIVRAAHETAHAIVDRGRGSDDPAIVERLVAYTDAHGIDAVGFDTAHGVGSGAPEQNHSAMHLDSYLR